MDKRRPPLTKQALRTRVWTLLERRGVGRFPLPLTGRIPNFAGAVEAANQLAALPEWRAAKRLKCNPDAPQRAVRLRALREGKDVYVAVPRLAAARCFLHLDPRRLGDRLAGAATITGAAALGVPIAPHQLPRIDLVVVGSVAVNRKGRASARAAATAIWSSRSPPSLAPSTPARPWSPPCTTCRSSAVPFP